MLLFAIHANDIASNPQEEDKCTQAQRQELDYWSNPNLCQQAPFAKSIPQEQTRTEIKQHCGYYSVKNPIF